MDKNVMCSCFFNFCSVKVAFPAILLYLESFKSKIKWEKHGQKDYRYPAILLSFYVLERIKSVIKCPEVIYRK